MGNEASSLVVTNGYFRPSERTTEIVPCPVADACIGGAGVVGNNSCLVGNTGVLCAICSDGFYRPSAFVPCQPCGNEALAFFSALCALLGMGLGVWIFIMVNRRAPSGLLRPFINLVQQLVVMLVSHHAHFILVSLQLDPTGLLFQSFFSRRCSMHRSRRR